jgi:hypothetical protein
MAMVEPAQLQAVAHHGQEEEECCGPIPVAQLEVMAKLNHGPVTAAFKRRDERLCAHASCAANLTCAAWSGQWHQSRRPRQGG